VDGLIDRSTVRPTDRPTDRSNRRHTAHAFHTYNPPNDPRICMQVAQGRLGISAANPFLAPAGGLLAVGLGSLSASLAADRAPTALCAALGVPVPASVYGARGGWTLFADEDWEGDPEGVALRGGRRHRSRKAYNLASSCVPPLSTSRVYMHARTDGLHATGSTTP
jgi:hypothetical protein